MAKVNATTGKVIIKNDADYHLPHDLDPVRPEQQTEEHADMFFRHMKDESDIVAARIDDDEPIDQEATGDGPEEQLQVIDESLVDEQV